VQNGSDQVHSLLAVYNSRHKYQRICRQSASWQAVKTQMHTGDLEPSGRHHFACCTRRKTLKHSRVLEICSWNNQRAISRQTVAETQLTHTITARYGKIKLSLLIVSPSRYITSHPGQLSPATAVPLVSRCLSSIGTGYDSQWKYLPVPNTT